MLRRKRAFEVKQKAFLIIFKGLSVPKYYLRSEGELNIKIVDTSFLMSHRKILRLRILGN